jgi:hypothetical protein
MKLSSRLALLTKLNAALRQILLALWPEENKSWGLAFASESVAIDSPHKQLRWLLGGIPVLARQRFDSFLNSLRRPIGVGPNDLIEALPSRTGGRRQRIPRLVLALLFLIFVWLLWQPSTRAVFRSVSESYAAQGWDPEHWPEVHRLQSLAQNSLASEKPDPQLLAFVSLFFRDESKRLSMADLAIRTDPALTWIDYHNAVLWNDTMKQHTLATIRIDRLFAADPGNAVLYLLRAESIFLPYSQEDAEADPKALRITAWGSLASGDPRWLAAMHDAFSAPRYDPYDQRLFQLAKNVMARYSVNDPRVLAAILAHRPFFQYSAMNTYVKILLSEVAEAQRAGDNDSAIRSCSLMLDFAQRLRATSPPSLESWAAYEIDSQVLPQLQSLYEGTGRHREALAIAARIQENRDERKTLTSGLGRSRRSFSYWSRGAWAALAMQTSVLAIWILLPLSLASIVLLWFLRTRLRTTHGFFHSLLCLFSDLCPSLLVLASAVLFMTYVPYDESFRKLLSGPFSQATFRQIVDTAYAPFSLPFSVRSAIDLVFFDRFFQWSAFTAALILLLAFIVARNLPKRPVTPST